jgi:Argonaute siRNA chaperone (ARC) complex subunit Arb1
MDSDRRHIFTKYMSYGGVDMGPKMFQGNDQRDLQDMNADDILTATSQSTIPTDRSGWIIDFELVVKGYLYVPLN